VHVNRWEAGMERVPTPVMNKAEKLYVQMQKKAAQQPKEEELPMVLVGPEYPPQEAMIGPDYQATVPKQVGSGKEKKEARKDVLIWSIWQAAKEGIDIDLYLKEVRDALKEACSLEYNEDAALTILHDLKYNQRSALNALKFCVAWEQGDAEKVAALGWSQPSSILWLHRLRSAALDSKERWTKGQREALDWGCEKYGKDLAEVHKHVLQEVPYPKFIQLYYQWSELPRPPASP